MLPGFGTPGGRWRPPCSSDLGSSPFYAAASVCRQHRSGDSSVPSGFHCYFERRDQPAGQHASAVLGTDLRAPLCCCRPYLCLCDWWPEGAYGSAAAVIGLRRALGRCAVLIAWYVGPYLASMVSALVTMVGLVVLLLVWKPRTTFGARKRPIVGPPFKAIRQRRVLAWSPTDPEWSRSSCGGVQGGVEQGFGDVPLAGLHKMVMEIAPVVPVPTATAIYRFDWLSAAGTAGVLSHCFRRPCWLVAGQVSSRFSGHLQTGLSG